MKFEWDPIRAASQEKKHGVSFSETASVFGDPWALTFADPDHSAGEHRFLAFGVSQARRPLVVSHVDRKDRTRIISARLMERSERRIYEDG